MTNTKHGVVINISATDPPTDKMLQVAAIHMVMGCGASGCSHCGNKVAKSCETKDKPVYACPKGCYKGAKTKDGRCPKCGMDLKKQP